MIKKFLIGLCSLFFIMPAMAVDPMRPTTEAVRFVVNTKVDADKRDAVVQAILDKISVNQAGISVQEMMEVCSAAGWDISTPDGKETCKAFVINLVEKSAVDFKHVCKFGGGTCLEDFSKVQVNSRDAVALAKKLIAKRDRKAGQEQYIICAWEKKNWDKHNNDDFIPCVSLENDGYYEVRFDDATESVDRTRRDGVVNAVCKVLNGASYSPEVCVTTGQQVGSQTICEPATCATSDENVCNSISAQLQDFGAYAKFKAKTVSGRSTCDILFDVIKSGQDLKNPFRDQGIDNFVFCRGIQVMGNATLDDSIEQYVRSKVKNITSFSCKKGDRKYTGGGCSSSFGDRSDDVITCVVNGKEVDFVFDDLAEAWEKYSKGGYQGISCIASDGTFDGKTCMGVNEQACDLVKAQSSATCPDCKDVYWDKDNNLCVLPSSKNATNWQKGISVAGTVVTVAAATAVTVFSGGTAAPGAWAVVAAVGSGLTIAGGTAVVASKVATTYTIYTDSFRSKLNTCLISDDVQCAKDMLQENLQKMVNYEKQLTDAEKKTLDESFAQLFKKIPVEDEFWNWLDDENIWVHNSRGDYVVKDHKQFWQKVRTYGDIAMILGGVLKSFAVIASQMTNTTDVVIDVAQTRKARIVENPLKNVKSNLVKDVTYGNTNSLSIPNSFLKQGVTINGKTMTFARNSELAQYLVSQGYKVGDTVEIALEGIRQTVIVPTTTISFANVVFNPLGLASTVYGTGDLLIDGESIPFVMRRPTGEEEMPIEPEPVPEPVPEPEPEPEPEPVVPTPTPTPTPTPQPQRVSEPTPTVLPLPAPLPITTIDQPATVPDVLPTPSSGSAPIPSNNTPTTPDNKKKGISGLGVAAIGAGVAGVGIGAALLLAGDKESKTSGAAAVSNNVDLFNSIKTRVAGGFVGPVNGASAELMPIDSISGIGEKIVGINGHAVVLVKHNNNKIPFMVDVENGIAKWVAFTNVNMNTGTFTKYDAKVDIMRTSQIAEKLAEVLPPLQMQYFASPNADGVQFAAPSVKGYDQINDNDLRHL